MSVLLHREQALKRVYVASGVVLAAWLALVVWSLSPYGVWLDHGDMGEIEASLLVRLVVFTIGWTLMVVAMMLPGALPVLTRSANIAPLLAGWVAVWLGFGAMSFLADNLLHAVVHRIPALAEVVAPALLLLAGIYQLTPIKGGFLARCRPEAMEEIGFGHTGMHERWFMGVRHGVNCVGSCWALMLLMMAFGGMNLVGMVLLGVVMTAERLTRHGRTLALVIGVVLIAAAAAMAVQANGVPQQAVHTH